MSKVLKYIVNELLDGYGSIEKIPKDLELNFGIWVSSRGLSDFDSFGWIKVADILEELGQGEALHCDPNI